MFVDTSNDVIKQMKNAARRGCRKIAKEIVQETIEHAPNKRGYVRKSMKFGASISSHTGQASGKVGYVSKRKLKEMGIKFVINPAWMEFGVKPHIVESGAKRRDGRKTKILANKSSGKMFGRIVQHPGHNPIPMLRISAQRVAPRAESIAATEIKVLNETIESLRNVRDDGNDDID